MPITLDHLRRYAVARSLFKPTTLGRAIDKLGFVQADPIRAPARAQDLTLRHRVIGYRAGDLERRYSKLKIEEDCLVNYGFLPRAHLALMHPRVAKRVWDTPTKRRAAAVLEFIKENGPTHPREVEQHFAHGRVTNYWGGSSNATTHLLDGMHYRGMLRIARRDSGTRVYEAVAHQPADNSAGARSQRAAALVELILRKYAPLPASSLTHLVYLLGYGAPHLVKQTQAAMRTAREHLASIKIDGTTWYWPADENPASRRFEAYTPAEKRKLGYYALPLLWRDLVVGWGNLTVSDGKLKSSFGYASGAAPVEAGFRRELEAELARMSVFLGIES
jgi:uncharacterized protein YcaQ